MTAKYLLQQIELSAQAILSLKDPSFLTFFQKAVDTLTHCFASGHKVLIAGNGGSLAEAIHFAEELTGQFRRPRPPLSAIALADGGHITCTANDYGFAKIFSRGVEAHGKRNDVFIALSTSGNSENIYEAIKVSQKLGLKTVSFLGKDGGKCRGLSDAEWIVKGFSTSDRIQEAHMTALHLLVEMIENALFPFDPSEQVSHAVPVKPFPGDKKEKGSVLSSKR